MNTGWITATLIDCIAAMPCAAGIRASARITKLENAKKIPATSPAPSAPTSKQHVHLHSVRACAARCNCLAPHRNSEIGYRPFMSRIRVAQVSAANGPFELVDRERPEPPRNAVRIAVDACGICHSDVLTRTAAFPGIALPRVPGHEVVGRIEALGPDVEGWEIGQRVGVGWHGGYCGHCDPCRRGQFFACITGPPVTGISHDGGYGEAMIAPVTSLARVPDGLTAIEAAPLLCAGVTTFNALRRSGARSGDLVAVHGLGGLGHLGVQYAKQMGFETVAVARGADKARSPPSSVPTATSTARPRIPRRTLTAMGGARVVLATVTDADAMSAMIGGLGIEGELLVLGAPHAPLAIPAFPLIAGRRRVQGCYSGVSIDSEDTLAFSVRTGVRSMNEVVPLAQVSTGYDRMMSGKARFPRRAVDGVGLAWNRPRR
jgi:D-arabinose 1-dehydrogenase-like Zn-dependent alcohol dehydrogenase